jgi:hypothetical protein
MFLSAKSILKGNTVDVYFYLQTGMIELDFEKKITNRPGWTRLKKNKIWTGPGRRQFIS